VGVLCRFGGGDLRDGKVNTHEVVWAMAHGDGNECGRNGTGKGDFISQYYSHIGVLGS
jgi:hypothetical protein